MCKCENVHGPEVVQMGEWSWEGGSPKPAYVVVLNGRVWGTYCYRSVADGAAKRAAGNNTGPLLHDYTPWTV